MTDPTIILQRLQKSLQILEQREAKYGPDAPASLKLEIEDHQKAIGLTRQLANGDLSETAWREQLKPLLVEIEERRATEAVTSLNIGGVTFSDISGSTIKTGDIDAGIHAGGDVVGRDKVSQTAEGSNIAQASHGGHAEVNTSTFDQRGQQVGGGQYNAGRDLNITNNYPNSPRPQSLSDLSLYPHINRPYNGVKILYTGAAVAKDLKVQLQYQDPTGQPQTKDVDVFFNENDPGMMWRHHKYDFLKPNQVTYFHLPRRKSTLDGLVTVVVTYIRADDGTPYHLEKTFELETF